MNLRVVKVDLHGIERQLERIADALEGILGATDPIQAQASDFPGDDTMERAFYNNDADEIIAAKLAKLGKEYKPFITRK